MARPWLLMKVQLLVRTTGTLLKYITSLHLRQVWNPHSKKEAVPRYSRAAKASNKSARLGTARAYYGKLSILTTGAQLPCLWSAITSAFSPRVYSAAITYIKLIHPRYLNFAKFHGHLTSQNSLRISTVGSSHFSTRWLKRARAMKVKYCMWLTSIRLNIHVLLRNSNECIEHPWSLVLPG
jgi:hypothetical protein